MAKKTETDRKESKETPKTMNSCADKNCPVHGTLSVRGRTFQGTIIKKFPKRITIAFERTEYVRKYERYIKYTSKIHARLPDCMEDKVQVGDYVKVRECRPLSKIIHFVFTEKIRDADVKEKKK
jgi:small subunit ribosomal protein S17